VASVPCWKGEQNPTLRLPGTLASARLIVSEADLAEGPGKLAALASAPEAGPRKVVGLPTDR
jgi:hypothetical protein